MKLYAVSVSCNGISVTAIATLEDAAARGACMTGTRENIEAQQGCKSVVAFAFEGVLQECLDECHEKAVGYTAFRQLPAMKEGALGSLSIPFGHPTPSTPSMCGSPWPGSYAFQEGF